MIIQITEAEYQESSNDNMGYCISCGQIAECVEPDARNYGCENCGKAKVFGADELLIMGMIEFIEDNRPDDYNDYLHSLL